MAKMRLSRKSREALEVLSEMFQRGETLSKPLLVEFHRMSLISLGEDVDFEAETGSESEAEAEQPTSVDPYEVQIDALTTEFEALNWRMRESMKPDNAVDPNDVARRKEVEAQLTDLRHRQLREATVKQEFLRGLREKSEFGTSADFEAIWQRERPKLIETSLQSAVAESLQRFGK